MKRTYRSRATVLVAMLSVLLLAVPAWATSGVDVTSFDNSPDTANDPVATTTQAATTVSINTLEVDFGGGITVTHASDPNAPNVGEKVGELSIRTRLREAFCFLVTYTLDATWDSVDAGAPSGTVAQLEVELPTGGTLPAYVIEDNGDYSIWTDLGDPPTNPCSNVSATITASTYSHSATSNAVVARNAGAGNYTLTVAITEHDNTAHSDTVGYSVS